jgi:DNA-binding beta-propeller fold protein YncE
MTRHDIVGLGDGTLPSPRRNHFFYSKLLDVPHLEMEQSYGRDLRYLLNRVSLGTGVLCGLGVEPHAAMLRVLPGVAVDPLGREIVVSEPFAVDPWRIGDVRRSPDAATVLDPAIGHEVTLCLSFEECLTDWSPVLVTDCDTGHRSAPGTVVESFRAGVHEGAPDGTPGLTPEQCTGIFGPAAGAGRGTRAEVAAIDVGGTPAGIVVSADGARALVLNELTGLPVLQVLDVAAGTVTHELRDNRLELPFGGASVAPEGGPVLVTHANGVAVVDLAAQDPVLSTAVRLGRPYGLCAAAYAGSVLFAVDAETGLVDRVDVGADTVTATVDPGDPVADLAVSPPDSRWLYVTLTLSAPVVRVDTQSNQISSAPVPGTEAGGTLAVRATASGIESWAAYPGQVVVAREGGPSQNLAGPAAPRDSAFSRDGETYYLLGHGDAGNDAILSVFRAGERSANGGVSLGPGASSLAVANGDRALVAFAGDGVVRIVDRGRLSRYELVAEQLSGPCAPASEENCVVIAVVTLLPGGRIGAIETRRRKVLPSNAVLLDRIVCLAARLDACCTPTTHARIRIDPAVLPPGRVEVSYPDLTVTASGGNAPYVLRVVSGVLPPGLTAQSSGIDGLALSGTPTAAGSFGFILNAEDDDGNEATHGYVIDVAPAAAPPMRILTVEFMERPDPAQPVLVPMAELRLGGQPPTLPSDQLVGIRVTFTSDVDLATVTTIAAVGDPEDTASFLVHAVGAGGGGLPGRITQSRLDEATFEFLPALDVWPPGEYRVTLFGEDVGPLRAIRAVGASGSQATGSTARCRPTQATTRRRVTASKAATSHSTWSSTKERRDEHDRVAHVRRRARAGPLLLGTTSHR